MSCAQSTNDDVRDLINGATSKEDDPQKIVQEIEKGLQTKDNCDEDYFAQGPVMIITSQWELGVWMPKGCVCTTLFVNSGDLSNIYSGGLEV